MKPICKLSILSLLFFISSACASAQTIEILPETQPLPATEPETIAIGLMLNASNIKIDSPFNGGISAVDADGARYLFPSGPLQLTALSEGIMWILPFEENGRISKSWRIKPLSGDSISVDGKFYRGEIYLEHKNNGDSYCFSVANIIDIENYLRGVVPREIGFVRLENFEAMKAQAVAARTYAVRNIGKRKNLGFDLFATSEDQNYGGAGAETLITDSAVKVTEGEVLVWNGEVIDAFYHSTCGGHTASLSDVWSGEKPYLVGVDDMLGDSAACSNSKYFHWTEIYSDTSLRTFAGSAKKIGIGILERDASGRNKVIEIVRDENREIVRGDMIRRKLLRSDGGLLRSTLFEVIPETGALRLLGHGWGHGIGMCQMGAIGRARAGWKYQEILLHYYTGAEIKRMGIELQ